MALQYNGLGTHGRLPQYSWMPGDNDDEGDSGSSSSTIVIPDMATETHTKTATAASAEITDSNPYTSKRYGHFPGWPAGPDRSTMTDATSLGEQYTTSTTDNTIAVTTSRGEASWSSAVGNDYDEPPFASRWTRHGIYAVAAIVPIMVLAVMGGIVFFCLRRRRRQRRGFFGQEMKTQRQTVIQPFMAPLPPTTSPHFAVPPNRSLPMSSLNAPPPVILGPIPSGPNGAYLTGIDTSDRVSVTSNNNQPVDPFADNLAEPPPPYRPRSVAPPSFVSASRQSSVRAPQPPPTSQTRLMEPSPFDDADEEDDDISELSGPITGEHDDNMSAVSDLSYQHDPVVGRTAL